MKYDYKENIRSTQKSRAHKCLPIIYSIPSFKKQLGHLHAITKLYVLAMDIRMRYKGHNPMS